MGNVWLITWRLFAILNAMFQNTVRHVTLCTCVVSFLHGSTLILSTADRETTTGAKVNNVVRAIIKFTKFTKTVN